ncbi:MAG TPA: PQQ-binding-like beta-propeller repeat protein, partial [Longimicrobiaceae bacterium]|nr:PQQ-binding-like beta-propeller repeat protein [Longimicrobiaceae bacterium]
APVTLLAGNAPEVERLTAVAREGSVTLHWDNPALHSGVVVLRAADAAPNLAPTPGRSYTAGNFVGNATVVYSDTAAFSAASSFTDTNVVNGTTYYYRVHNADDSRWYSAGNRPTSSALVATPRARVAGAPLWCYSVGLDARQQPITELGVGIYSAFNNSVVGNLTQTTNPAQDGAERWRPLPLSGFIGSRFPVVPLRGLTGQYILTADQAGIAYAINASTGQVHWRWDNGGAPIGTIQSFPVVQLHDFANAAYQAAHPGRDLVFFATRLPNPAQNRVVALNAATGAPVWTYQPGDLGMVSGGMVVDYATNRLYVGSMTHAASTDSLRIINSLTGVELARRPVGDIEVSLARNSVTNHLLATSSDGDVHAIDAATMAPVWTVHVADRPAPSTPAFTSFVRPQGGGFVASTAQGQVAFYNHTGPVTDPPTLVWSTPIPNPSGVFSINRNGVPRIYVGSSDGRVHQLELADGTDSQQVSIGGAQRIGTPTIDSGVGRLHVGSEDGRICAFPVPFP